MIAIGVAAVQRFRWVLLIFALVLIVSAYKMLGEEDENEDLSENFVMRLARWLVDATDQYDGDKFFTTVGNKRRATPMLVVLVCIELSDVIFAVDSIPAVVGITQDAFVVYTSNAFALLALRSLYLLLSRSIQQLHYLRHAVALILAFVGIKMVSRRSVAWMNRAIKASPHEQPICGCRSTNGMLQASCPLWHIHDRCGGVTASGPGIRPLQHLLFHLTYGNHLSVDGRSDCFSCPK